MGDIAVNTFYNYINHLIYTENNTLLGAIRIYLLDNNIPIQYKNMNCIHDTINVVANRYTNEMNIFNNNNNNNNYIIPNDIIYTLTQLQEVQNLMLYNNIIH
jgi:hypothetical protein